MDFVREYDLSLLIALGEHLRLVAVSLLIAVAIGLPLGATAWWSKRAARALTAVASVIQTIPSIALFGLLIPVLSLVDRGIGAVPATIALVLYAQLPIIRNTSVALSEVPDGAVDAARGMGMTEIGILWRVALPLAVPGIIAGIRSAATMSIGVAAVATYIGAGGLGFFIARGIETTWSTMTIAGAIGIVLLALVVDIGLSIAERLATPKRRRASRAGGGAR